MRAHPRVGGENAVMNHPAAAALGSSPRGRGKPPRRVALPTPGGLIPAWAGKTFRGWCRSLSCPAHPRVGGENVRRLWRRGRRWGSSPRGRGKHLSAMFDRSAGGLIPAWAGKT